MLTHGGLKKRNSRKTGFQPISDMIMARGTTFKVLTVDSLKGYMIIMFVEGENYEYFTHNDEFTDINKPVTQYILKFAITDDGDEQALDPFMFDGHAHDKASDRKEDFFLEARMQTDFWWNSVTNGGLPVCPSVANISFFSDDAANLLDVIVSKPYGDTPDSQRRQTKKLQSIRDYLIGQLGRRRNRSIGMITQNLLQSNDGAPARKLCDVLDDNGISESDKRNLIIFAAAQVLRLYLDFHVVHCDLHLGNILVADNICYIIDFGRVFNFFSLDYRKRDAYPKMYATPRLIRINGPVIDAIDPHKEIPTLHETASRAVARQSSNPIPDSELNTLIQRIFESNIVIIDTNYFDYFFGRRGYQMRGLMSRLTRLNQRERIYSEIYREYKILSTPRASLPPGMIDDYISRGLIEHPRFTLFNNGTYDNTRFPAGQPAAARPAARPAARRVVQPAPQPAARRAAQPAAQPAAQLVAQPEPEGLKTMIQEGVRTVLSKKINGDSVLCFLGKSVCVTVIVMTTMAMISGRKNKRNKNRKTHKNCKTHKKR